MSVFATKSSHVDLDIFVTCINSLFTFYASHFFFTPPHKKTKPIGARRFAP